MAIEVAPVTGVLRYIIHPSARHAGSIRIQDGAVAGSIKIAIGILTGKRRDWLPALSQIAAVDLPPIQDSLAGVLLEKNFGNS